MLQCGRVLDATTVLGDACARARETFRSVIRLEDDDVSLLRGA